MISDERSGALYHTTKIAESFGWGGRMSQGNLATPSRTALIWIGGPEK